VSILRRIACLLVLIAVVSLPAVPSPAFHAAALASSSTQRRLALNGTVYLPIVVSPRAPIGIIATPAELRATRALADRGVEPSAKAVRKLLDDAADGLLFAPCAMASYTNEAGRECLNQSSRYAFVLALAYWLTYDTRYSEHAAALLRAWYTTLVEINPQPPSDTTSPWLDWSRWAPAMIWGADLLRGTSAWSETDRQQFTAMLLSKVLLMGQNASTRRNNWADAGNSLRLAIAIYANLPAERAAAIANWKALLDYGLAADGSLPEENRRSVDGLAYNQVALSYKTVFAEMLRRRGDSSLYSYTTPNGKGLKDAWDFLAPHVVSIHNGVCDWPYTLDHCATYSNHSAWEIAYSRWHAPAYLGPLLLERPYRWGSASDPGYATLLYADLDISTP